MVKSTAPEEGTLRIYEAGFLLTPSLPEEKVPEETAKLRDMIAKEGGNIIAEEEPKLRELAYSMDKTVSHKRETFTSAYFGWIKFEIGAEAVAFLKKAFDANPSIVRFLLISTVRENTLASKRPMGSRGDGRRRTEAKMSDEEIEKTIEQLVAE
ncbi:MAG: 30S ribosomal protein S6 [bacterium]|nr:30S ribosomal protein S6 [bacterium]